MTSSTNSPREQRSASLCPLGAGCALRAICVRRGHLRPERPTVPQAIDYFLCRIDGDVKDTTIKSYVAALRPLRRLRKPIEEVTIDDLQAVKVTLVRQKTRYGGRSTRPVERGGLSNFTLHKNLRTWRRLFNFLVEELIIGRNPAAKLKLPSTKGREPKHSQPDDLARMYRASECARDRAIIGLFADTGIRVGALVGIRLREVDLRRRRVKIHDNKADKEFYVRFKARTARDLRQFIDVERRTGSDQLFTGTRGDLTTGGVYLILKRLAQKAGVSGRFNPHSIRHALARKMLHDGRSLKDVQTVLHHEDESTTARSYAVYLDEEAEELYDTCDLLALKDDEAGE